MRGRSAGGFSTLTQEPSPSVRSDRAGGDTETPRSRRTPKLPEIALAALRERTAAHGLGGADAAGPGHGVLAVNGADVLGWWLPAGPSRS
jgi:hypothetical protein